MNGSPPPRSADINPHKKKAPSFFSSACIAWPFFRRFWLRRRRSLGQGGVPSQQRSAVSPTPQNPDVQPRPHNGYDPDDDDDEGGFQTGPRPSNNHLRNRTSPPTTRFRPRQSSPHHVIRSGGLSTKAGDSIAGLSGIHFNNNSCLDNSDVSAIPFHKRKSMEQMEKIILSPLSLTTTTIQCEGFEDLGPHSSRHLMDHNRFNASSSTKFEGHSYPNNDNNNIAKATPNTRPPDINKISRKMTVEQSDDLYDLVTSFQSHRMDDQRSDISLMIGPGRADSSTLSMGKQAHKSDSGLGHHKKLLSSKKAGSSNAILHPTFSLSKRFSLKKKESVTSNAEAKNERKKSKNHTVSDAPHKNNNVAHSQITKTNLPASLLPSKSVKDQQQTSTITKKGPEEEDFFDMVFRCQGARIDDQRVEGPNLARPPVGEDEIIDLVGKMQSGRIEGQRSFITHPARRH